MSQIAQATIAAAEKAFSFVMKDVGYTEAVWLMTQMAIAAKKPDILLHLAAAGIHLPADPSLTDVTTAITEALDRRVEGNGKRSDLGMLANRAIVGAVNDVLAPKLHSLFSSDPDTMRAALADLGKPREFGEFSRHFFARLANEGLQYFLSKVVNTQLGELLSQTRCGLGDAISGPQHHLPAQRRQGRGVHQPPAGVSGSRDVGL
ncbi:hypothetical protein [Ralstonia mannitolilytica]|uniref:hypothetical protein n=1 Tax=Ralstonia mannitolilytica TaxID=105219 RepID=UPI0015F058C0|nr:hypothetical protein [Ralstonia mannitolilytica]